MVEGGCLSKIYRWRKHFFCEIADKVDVEEKNKSCPICSVIRSPTCTPCIPNKRGHLYFSSAFTTFFTFSNQFWPKDYTKCTFWPVCKSCPSDPFRQKDRQFWVSTLPPLLSAFSYNSFDWFRLECLNINLRSRLPQTTLSARITNFQAALATYMLFFVRTSYQGKNSKCICVFWGWLQARLWLFGSCEHSGWIILDHYL